MTRLILVAMLAAYANAAPAADTLESRVKQADGWVAWSVPMVADAGAPCCFSGNHHNWQRTGCNLDDRDRGFSTTDDPRPPTTGTLTVYAHVARSRIDDVRAFEASCPVRSNGEIRHLDGIAQPDSIDLLSKWMDGPDGVHDELALAAIAYHADGMATHVLASRAEAAHPRKEREDALFWLGQARGADGAAIVERVATTDGDPKLREHAIFALSESHAGDPYARIHAISQSDPSDHVRSQALFWMAQMNDARAAADITAAISRETSGDVREQAVFALSQLDGEKGDEALIALMRGNYPRDVKKQALFWLGESGSPKAMQYFDEALTRSR
jgi:HEAT repeat protein